MVHDARAETRGYLRSVVLLVNLAATWFMAGVIWVVQLVHYAQFDGVGAEEWAAYHRRHTAGVTFVVGPGMLIELVTAAWLCAQRPRGVPIWAAWLGLGLVVLLWVSTAAVQVPLHNRLAGGFDAEAARRLVATNWFRTAVWTGRGILVTWMAWRAMR